MIRLSDETIRGAFKGFCLRRRTWVRYLTSQFGMYEAAAMSFGPTGSAEDFKKGVYEKLKSWKVFRGGRVQPAEWIYEKLRSLDNNLRQLRLSQVGDGDWPDVWKAVVALREVKENQTGPSVMALSKFLHFWNPRLFVICDVQEVEQFVFGHHWLKQQLDAVDYVHPLARTDSKKDSPLVDYLRVLAVARGLVKDNPGVLPEFVRTVEELVPEKVGLCDTQTYEATAAEWCLVGLAEMPPHGVEIGA